MFLGTIFMLAGVLLMALGVMRLWRWQGSADDADLGDEWFDGSRSPRIEPKFPGLNFTATVVGPLLGGAILIVFGLVQWAWR